MSKIVHFEVNADDPERAGKFFTDVFNWEIQKWDGPMDYWLVKTGPDNEPGLFGGAIMKRMEPAASVFNTIAVENIDETLEKVAKAGGSVITQKSEIPGIGLFAYIKDTEGNTFGILQPFMKQ